jgi:hypothetical protein
VRANLHACRNDLANLVTGEQRPHWTSVPCVGSAKLPRDDEHRRREVMALKLGDRVLEHPDIAVVERQANKPLLASLSHGVDHLPHRDAAQTLACQPGQLLGEPGRRHAQVVRVLIHLTHCVIHQDHRHPPRAEPA